MPEDNDLVRRIKERRWFHTIDLGNGLVTRGDSPHSEVIAQSIPELQGKTVLDIGAWDGKYSFEAESRGARRVVALDHYVWKLDWPARQAYYEACEAEGMLPDPDRIDNDFLVPDGLPGKEGFDLIHQYCRSEVEPVVDDFMTMDLTKLGTFDVVFYFGVLYHMKDPVGALQRLRRVTKGVAIVETAAVEIPGYPENSLLQFYAANELHADYGNWFAPTAAALCGMCRAAGFRRVEVTARSESFQKFHRPRLDWRRQTKEPLYGRICARAYP
jgi:tRNA (mo5U34)-methyltransferase